MSSHFDLPVWITQNGVCQSVFVLGTSDLEAVKAYCRISWLMHEVSYKNYDWLDDVYRALQYNWSAIIELQSERNRDHADRRYAEAVSYYRWVPARLEKALGKVMSDRHREEVRKCLEDAKKSLLTLESLYADSLYAPAQPKPRRSARIAKMPRVVYGK